MWKKSKAKNLLFIVPTAAATDITNYVASRTEEQARSLYETLNDTGDWIAPESVPYDSVEEIPLNTIFNNTKYEQK